MCGLARKCLRRLVVLNIRASAKTVFTRNMSSESPKKSNRLLAEYARVKLHCFSKKLPPDVEQTGVFANNELHLKDVDVYGFDYDYTLADYRVAMHNLIYDLGKKALVDVFKYPSQVSSLSYLPDFAVRGLHYDIKEGLLLKVDAFHQIQLGSVYRGLRRLSNEEVLRVYGSVTLPVNYLEPPHGHSECHMVQLADLFSLPEMCLMCQVTELFLHGNIDFQPTVLFHDVRKAIASIHPVMHGIVAADPARFLHRSSQLVSFLERLVSQNKKLFLITNSPYHFVNAGLTFLVGEDWRRLFDLVIVEAGKPNFFTCHTHAMRVFDTHAQCKTWRPVNSIEPGTIYCEGNVRLVQQLTGWSGGSVLYFGDHPYTDLADVRLHHGWRTGAIIWELEREIGVLNQAEFKARSNWLQQLQQLIETEQDELMKPLNVHIMREWIDERNQLRQYTKHVLNAQFGSLFRTHHNPTYFSRRLFHVSDIYMSRLSNLLNYSLSHVFFPRRGALPHEYRSMFV